MDSRTGSAFVQQSFSMTSRFVVPALFLVFGVLIGLQAQSAPPTVRKMMETLDLGDGKEVRMWVAEIAPGTATSEHSHPGYIVAYMLDGSITHTVNGKPPVTIHAGETWHEHEEVHQGRNLSKTAVARFLTVQITEHGKPINQ
jgi:quercetin dioxygenase-like cupin family protein